MTPETRVERTLDEALARKMTRRGEVTYAPLVEDELVGRLRAFLAEQLDVDHEVSDLARLTGGASAEQFTFTLRRGDGAERMVLRLNPPMQVLETHREREFQILRAVADDLPVPTAHWYADSDSAFGAPTLVTSFNPGVAAPPGSTGKATGLSTAYGEFREALAPQFVEHLARLHTIDWRTKELSALDVPREGTTDAVDWRIALWDRVWAEDTYEPHPTVALAREWLWANRPAVDTVSLLHGDYRNGNFLFDPDSGRITIVLDWELGHLGDRHFDLAYSMLPGYGHVVDGTYLCAGLVDADTLIADYQRLSGLEVDAERLRYYRVLNMYWAVVACSATAPRAAAEAATHHPVMMNFVAGLGAFFISELNKILREA